jgi:hypothetical protein
VCVPNPAAVTSECRKIPLRVQTHRPLTLRTFAFWTGMSYLSAQYAAHRAPCLICASSHADRAARRGR